MATTAPVESPQVGESEATELAPMYNVVLLDDDDHTYEYVIRMITSLFGHDPQTALELTQEVDNSGRTILLTTTFERAEMKQDQVHSFGADPLLPRSQGAMSVILELA
jgi:ATP-dependent Clp protease adaptor protein ClpS